MRANVIAVFATVALLQTAAPAQAAAGTTNTIATEEWAALVDLYVATNGDHWIDHTGWASLLVNKTCDGVAGLSCSYDSAHAM